MDDRALLNAYVSSRSDEAFGQIVRRHLPLVYGVAFRRLGDHHAAEDVAQTVFLILARKAASLRRETALGAWLVKVAVYEAADARKRERRRRDREGRRMLQLLSSRSTADQAMPASVLETEAAPWVDEALARLSDGDRRAIVLRYISGLSNAEAASTLGITENACKQRVFRGLGRMKRFLTRRGMSTSTAAIAAMIPAMQIAHPSGFAVLAASITSAAHAAPALGLVKGILYAATPVKVALTGIATVAGAGMLITGGAIVAHHVAKADTIPLTTRSTAVRVLRSPSNPATIYVRPSPATQAAGLVGADPQTSYTVEGTSTGPASSPARVSLEH